MVKIQQCFGPEDIEQRSFEMIEAELDGKLPFQGAAWELARRLVHCTGDFSILDQLVIPDEAVQAGVRALLGGATVFTDTEMARAGMPVRRLAPLGVETVCLHKLPGVAEYARDNACTRSKAGVVKAGERLAGAIAAIGNAPTSLLALLDYLDAGGQPPALVLGMPVGFVNAEESKELLLRHKALPSIVLRGRRGGSALAAAAVNALAVLALREKSV